MKQDISRRDFLKTAGAGAAVVGLAACGHVHKTKNDEQVASQPEDLGPEEMVLRTNPNTGDNVSLLGYGCMRWQMKEDENGNSIVDQESVNELVDYALAHGVNYFDSSPVYLRGQSEEATAKALLRHPRESYYIATKCSNFSNWTFDNSVLMYKKSLEYYQTDHIDYYLLHALSGKEDFDQRFGESGLIDYFVKERELGHIRNLGFSFHGDQAGFDSLMALHDKYHWDFVQIQMNYVDWRNAGDRNTNAEYLYQELDKREIPIVIMEPLLGGRLSNVPDAIAEQLKTREPQKSIASWAFRFVGTKPRVLTVLSGMTYMEHLQDNLQTYLHFKPLTQEEMDFLQDLAVRIKEYPLVPCTACQYCMPCPYGIDIPGIFKYYNTAVNEGTYVVSSEQKGYRKLRKDYLTSYNKAIPTVRQADHCIHCGQCQPHCPQHIRIPDELHRIDEYMENLKQEKL